MADRDATKNNNATLTDDKIESPATTKVPYWRVVTDQGVFTLTDQGVVTQEVIDYQYPGAGTDDKPYSVTWISNDPRNPMLFGQFKKWAITMTVAIATLAVALVSSAYTGGIEQIEEEFGVGIGVATLGVSLFVLGVAICECAIHDSSFDKTK